MDKIRIVLFDLETLPNLQEALKKWTQLGNWPFRTMKATVTSVICAGWKVYGSRETHCINAWDYPKRWKKDVNDDYEVCKAIYEVLKTCDVVVTHNGKKFDWKFLQTRLLFHGLPVLPKILHVDTVELARRNLFAFSNRLGDIGETFVNEKKLQHTGWQLWVDTYNKCPKALNLMERYCKQDVKLLEKVFIKLMPFVKNMPNRNRYRTVKQIEEGTRVCPTCGEDKLQKNGMKHTTMNSMQRYRCRAEKCGATCYTNASGNNPRAM